MKKKIFFIFVIVVAIVVASALVMNQSIVNCGQKNIISNINNLPHAEAVMILGARVYGSYAMSDILRDRADTAIKIYQSGKADKILVSGDHGQDEYDEVNTVKNYLLEQNISSDDIFLDHAGFNTYDSMYRAKAIFNVNSLIISTQNFHLPRAVCLAKGMKIDAHGISADLRHYKKENLNQGREFLARIKAFVFLIFKPKPKFLGDDISIRGDGQRSWD
ncbi:MAG: ElyC/SanA/YdcF family protein [Candidatus Buchananbacteria bacterium]